MDSETFDDRHGDRRGVTAIFYDSVFPIDYGWLQIGISDLTTKAQLLMRLNALIPPSSSMVAAWVSWVDKDAGRIVTTTNMACMTDSRFQAALQDLHEDDPRDYIFVEYEQVPLFEAWYTYTLEPIPTGRSASAADAVRKQSLVLEVMRGEDTEEEEERQRLGIDAYHVHSD
jgi:hypothetical protein